MKHRWFKSASDLVISEIPAQRKAGGDLEAAHRGEFCVYLGKRGYVRKGPTERNTIACAVSGKKKSERLFWARIYLSSFSTSKA